MSDKDTFGAFAVGLFTGALLGGIAALLFAPQSGEDTRKLIKDKSVEVYQAAGKTLEETYAQAESALADARVKIEDLAAQAKTKGAEFQEKGQIMLEQIVKKEKPEAAAPEAPAEA